MEWIGTTVFVTILLAGLIFIAVARRTYTIQLERLTQHQKRLQGELVQAADGVFLTGSSTTNPKLVKLLVLAGLDDQYNRIKSQWIWATIGGGIIFTGVALAVAPTYAILLFLTGIMVGAGGYLIYLKIKGTNRQKKMTRQLPQVLDSMASTLKAGSSIMDVFRATADMAPEPIRTEFNRARSELQLNKSLLEVINGMTARITTRDFRFVVQAISISEQTGANLADVVAGITDALRERFKLADLVSSITAGGKVSAGMIGVMPYLLFLLYFVASPAYVMPLVTNPIARLIIVALVFWEFIGFFFLWKIASYEV